MPDAVKGKQTWAQVCFDTAAENEDMASWLMIQCGSSGCEIEPLDGSRVLVKATFDTCELSEGQLHKIKSTLEEYGLAAALTSLKIRSIEEEDWLVRWKEGFEPFQIGEHFLVCPPWALDTLSDEQRGSRTIILIEPGLAFGTGLHATTRYCMKTMESLRHCATVLDVGTGSAILAIAYAMLSAKSKITAVDNDPVAIEVASTNLELNNVSDRVELLLGTTESVLGRKFDCILSNLTCEDIVALLPDYLELLAPGGFVVCAGILREKLPQLEDALSRRNLAVVARELTDMWAGIVFERP